MEDNAFNHNNLSKNPSKSLKEKIEKFKGYAKEKKLEVVNKEPSEVKIKSTKMTLYEQIPIWENKVRGLPNTMARSSLFTVSNRSAKRKQLKKQLISSLKGTVITYTGEELRQDDEDVFLQLTHIARTSQVGDKVAFTALSMLTELGWDRSSRSYKRLKDCIERLSASNLIIMSEDGSEGYAGSLVRKFAWQDDKGASLTKWQIWLESEIVSLFGPTSYSKIDWEQRLQLNTMGKWLHAFYHTHEFPFAYGIDKLRTLCGSSCNSLYHFRRIILKSHDDLVSVGFLESWEHDARSDKIQVVRMKRPILVERIKA